MTTVGGSDVTRRVEVFRAGTFTAMSGQEFSFSAEDVNSIATQYDPKSAPAPVVVGHPSHDDPAFGWVKGFEVNDQGTLIAEIEQLAPEFVEAVEQGRYRKISMKFFAPNASNNPTPGQYYPRHVGFLGGAAPAVSGLAPVQFSDASSDDLVEIEFSLGEMAESTASIMRRMREFFIEKFGLEAADQAVPEYHIRWIEQAAQSDNEPQPGFSDPNPPENPPEGGDPDMSGNDDLAAREAALKKRERDLDHKDNVAFADQLISQARLTSAQKDSVVALLDALGTGGEDIAFSDGGESKTTQPGKLLRDILGAQPEIVPLGQTDMSGDPEKGADVAFAAPDNMDVDPEGLALHNKALAYQAQNPGTEYLAAVAAVEGGLS